jgi:hypothetical protein
VSTHVSEEVLEPLRRVLRWQLSLRDAEGRIVCPEHKVEHTGKSAYAALLAAELTRIDPRADREALVAAAAQQGRRLVGNLEREDTSPCHTFRPGRHDPYNCSNSVIDGGACSDALAHLVRTLGDVLAPADRDAFAAASLLHARTYLRYAVLDKGIPAQRAWALTGLAAANALEPDEILERAAIEAVGILEGIQHADGSYPYHPLEWAPAHPGASDASAFYQSRVTGFLLHSLETLGRDPRARDFRPPLVRGLDFLCGLQGPDGVKCGLVEAKPWYWGAAYEVASHPFDVLALTAGHRVFGSPRYALGAARAFRAWVAHLSPDGVPASHREGHGRGRSYQCPVFWAAHAAWIARVAGDLTRCLEEEEPQAPSPGGIDLAVTWFPGASLGRLEDGRITAWIRGARPGVNVHHGSPHGAGLLRCVRRADGTELVTRCRLGGHQEAEWTGTRGLPSLARGLRSGGKEVRFSLWLARVHRRAGRTAEALIQPARTFRRGVLAFGHSRVGSPFHLAPEVEILSDGILLRSALAWRDGTPVPGSALERTYRIDGEGLAVHERVLADGGVRGLRYQVPAAAVDVHSGPQETRFRLA